MTDTIVCFIIACLFLLAFGLGVIYGITASRARKEAHERHIRDRKNSAREEDEHYYNK